MSCHFFLDYYSNENAPFLLGGITPEPINQLGLWKPLRWQCINWIFISTLEQNQRWNVVDPKHIKHPQLLPNIAKFISEVIGNNTHNMRFGNRRSEEITRHPPEMEWVKTGPICEVNTKSICQFCTTLLKIQLVLGLCRMLQSIYPWGGWIRNHWRIIQKCSKI